VGVKEGEWEGVKEGEREGEREEGGRFIFATFSSLSDSTDSFPSQIGYCIQWHISYADDHTNRTFTSSSLSL
jgi:hypothetical protein